MNSFSKGKIVIVLIKGEQSKMQRSKPVFVYSTEPFAGGSFNSAFSLIDTFEKRKPRESGSHLCSAQSELASSLWGEYFSVVIIMTGRSTQ